MLFSRLCDDAFELIFGIFLHVIVLATVGFDLYIIASAFPSWVIDFALISGRDSSDLKWAVAIIVLAVVRIFQNILFAAVLVKVKKDHSGRYNLPVLSLACASLFQLVLAVPTLVAVGRRHWADILRAAGHADHAGAVEAYQRFQLAIIVIWAVLSGVYILLRRALCVRDDLILSM